MFLVRIPPGIPPGNPPGNLRMGNGADVAGAKSLLFPPLYYLLTELSTLHGYSRDTHGPITAQTTVSRDLRSDSVVDITFASPLYHAIHYFHLYL